MAAIDQHRARASVVVGVVLMLMVAAWWYLSADTPVSPLFKSVTLPESAPAMASPPASAAAWVARPTAWPLQAGERLAADVVAEFSQPTQALANRYKGQRIRVLGQVVDAQSSEDGIWLLSLDAAPSPKPLRVVMAVGKPTDPEAFGKGQSSVFDCLHGGIMLGEPLLSDCQVLRR